MDSPMKKPLLRMLWCVSVAPLGEPVVPEVNWMLIGSSNCSGARKRRSAALRSPARRAPSSSKREGAGNASPPIWITERSAGSARRVELARRGAAELGRELLIMPT